ncbi:hypothetical protein V7654_10320 [Bacillus sp. JJ1609]|uniref:hypothetical protein n=1 Tax=Bacillus sp. JJ1609 TaxID=3122977 RepID=UPI002FFDD8F4
MKRIKNCAVYAQPVIEIGVEGAKTSPKMLTHFHRAWANSMKQFSVLREQRDR